MSRKVKCPSCGTYNDKETAVYHSSKYYCPICYENKQSETNEYKELIAYICELYGLDAPTGWILKQIKDFKEQYNFTNKGIKSTLHYFFEIQEGNEPNGETGIGIVPFVYDEAKKFYLDKKAVKDSIANCDSSQINNNKKTIKIKRELSQTNSYKEIALIDIEKLV